MTWLLELRRLVREATGEAKWDDYLAHCREHGIEPIARRSFERGRTEGRGDQPRCC
ncbi:MAG TPA: CstA-like transporter-associated (seleno)protein [Nocardioidaceae bacterium]|nr:CstA-like transporter-associated (seleno)protein [Nocardioidaceae bacterium]